jgi:MoxR-like ATPase
VLWQAFTAEQPVALLIDEIDKADIEFPNDLLREIDRMEFYCYETRELVKAKHRPLVFITSNNEKELPDAFLRRCFFHYIKFPDADTMKQHRRRAFPRPQERAADGGHEDLLRRAQPARPEEEAQHQRAARLAQAAAGRGHPAEALHSKDDKVAVPPLVGALLKNEQDVTLFEKLVFMQRHNR